MKQIIVRIKDYDGKLIAKDYYYSQARFNDEGADFIYQFLNPGCEVQIKIGNLYSKYLTHSELLDIIKEVELLDNTNYNERECIYDYLINDYGVQYYMKEYLPKY